MAIQLHRKVSLEGIGEGWGPECHLLFKPLSLEAQMEIDEIKDTGERGLRAIEMIRKEFVSGRAIDENGKECDVEPKDLDLIIPVAWDRIQPAVLGTLKKNESSSTT